MCNFVRYSVIIPVYNRDKFLTRAIGSVMACYDNDDVEIIVVNDGGVILKGTPSGVNLYHLKINSGVSAARNWGVSMARGAWLCFLDSDDWFQPTYFRDLKAVRDNHVGGDGNSLDYCYCSFWEWREEGYCLGHTMVYTQDNRRAYELYQRDYIGMSTLSCSKSIFEQIGGFDSSLRCNEDWDFKLKLATHARGQSISQYNVNIMTDETGLYRQSIKTGLAKETEAIIKERFKYLA